MISALRATSFGSAIVLAMATIAPAQEPPKADVKKADATKADPSKEDATKADPSKADTKKAEAPRAPRTETATFGGGCFWCTEAVFERIPGVKSVVSGYSGGLVPNPTYEQVCTGQTGHAEVIEVVFDPDKVPYEDLLKVFWKSHDPTTLNSQGPDFGTQYRSIILYHSEDQKKAAQKVYQELKAKRVYRAPIVTELVPFAAFYPAERYHQDYYRNHRFEDYSLTYIAPKLRKMQAHPAPTPKPAAPKPAAPKPPAP